MQVEAYAQQFKFLQLEHDEVSEKLSKLERLLKQHGCYTSEELLEASSKAERSLDHWFQMEGKQPRCLHISQELNLAGAF